MYSHQLTEKDRKIKVLFSFEGAKPEKVFFDLGAFDSEAEALEAVEKAKLLHAEDLNDPKDKPQNRLSRFIDGTYHV